MSKKVNTEEFVNNAKTIHGEQYDYSLVIYTRSDANIEIICPRHGKFIQRAGHHLRGSGCKKCYDEKRIPTSETLINKFKEVHGDRYNYSLVEYKGIKFNVKIICPIHGVFNKKITNHINGGGCRKCYYERQRSDEKDFILKAKILHDSKYDYSLTHYKNNKEKIKIICPTHGIFEMQPINHLFNKQGCPECGRITSAKTQSLNNNDFIIQATKIHGDKYDYNLVVYKSNKVKVKIICPEHGEFQQTPVNHINNEHGCPSCNESKGERAVSLFLLDNNIKFIRQHTFSNCKNINLLTFDFYLPDLNICIEFNGIQHYKSVPYFGGDDRLKYMQKCDKIKMEYCRDNNIPLIVIRYDEDINEILSSKLIFIF